MDWTYTDEHNWQKLSLITEGLLRNPHTLFEKLAKIPRGNDDIPTDPKLRRRVVPIDCGQHRCGTTDQNIHDHRRLLDGDKQQNEEPKKDSEAGNDQEDYIAQRVRDTAAFERRANGNN